VLDKITDFAVIYGNAKRQEGREEGFAEWRDWHEEELYEAFALATTDKHMAATLLDRALNNSVLG
jgi:hypothetical protein